MEEGVGMLACEQVGSWGMQNCTIDEQAPIGMSACWHFRGLYIYKTRVGEDAGMSACRHVGTSEVYICKTRVGEGSGMSAL